MKDTVKVSNTIPLCSEVVSELLNRAVTLHGLDYPMFRHRIERLSIRAVNSSGTKESEAIRDRAAEAIIRGMLSVPVIWLSNGDIARLLRLRNEMKPQEFLFAVCDENPENWNAIKAAMVRSCTSLTLSGSHGAAYAFDALHTVLNRHKTAYQQRELSALLDAVETALALPTNV